MKPVESVRLESGPRVEVKDDGKTATRSLSPSGPEDPRVIRALEEYLAALEMGQRPDRQEFLARHAAIAQVLAGCLDGLEFMQTASSVRRPAAGDLLADSGGRATAPHPTAPLGDFCLLREVGRGGMGIVYEAEQMSLGRRVALKVLPFAAALDPKQLQRFKNEAQAAAHLHHTNIVPVFGVGCERGVHYYAMQYIEGQTLAAVIAELRQQMGLEKGSTSQALSPVADDLVSGRLAPVKRARNEAPSATPSVPPERTPAPIGDTTPRAGLSTERSINSAAYLRTVANLGIQAAEALEHAHQLGIVHRDIKPANLLIDMRGHLWITDFGLAHCQSQAGLTMTGDLVGTLRYMSPEQALGKRLLIDHRTDVYSLGVTLYELLTLEPAFGGSDREELLRQIAFEEPRTPRQRNKAIPRELETIVLKAMEKSPEGRYATAQELADDLQRFLEDKPIRAKRPTLVQRASKWSRRHKPLVGAVMVVGFLGALFAAAIGLWLAQQRTETAGRVGEALRRAGDLQAQSRWPEALEAAQRAEELLTLGGGSAELRQRVQGALADLRMILRLDDIRLEEEPIRRREEEAVREGGFHDLQALSFLYAEAFRNYGIDVDALEAAEAAQRIRARPINVELAAALDHWAHIRLVKMVGTSDEPKWQHVLAVARAVDRDDPWRNRLREHLGRSPEDMKILQELAASPELSSQSALTLHLLGNCLGDTGAVEAAVSVLRQAQQRHPDNFWITKDLADYLQQLGQPAEALRFRTVALVLRPHSVRMHNKLGNALLNQGALKQAIAAFNEGQRFVSEDTGIEIQWGDVLKRKEALEETIAVFQEASRLQPDEAGIYINWASALKHQGALDKAIAVYDQAIATVKKVRSRQPRPASIGALLHHAAGGRAEALLRLGRFEEAEQSYQEALALEPSFHYSWFCDAPLRLYLGDVEGYRRVCREMLARFSDTDDPKIADRTAKTCLLAPDAVSDLRPALQLALRNVTGTQQHWAYRCFLLNKGMADYRAGDFANAIDRLNQCLSLGPAPWYWSSRDVVATAHVFLAMAHHRLGHAEQARQALHQATLLMNPGNGKSGGNEPADSWDDWIWLQIARQEAERLLKSKAEGGR